MNKGENISKPIIGLVATLELFLLTISAALMLTFIPDYFFLGAFLVLDVLILIGFAITPNVLN